MVYNIGPNETKLYFTILDLSKYLDQDGDYCWNIQRAFYKLSSLLSECYTVDVDRLNRRFQPKSVRWCGNITKFYSEQIRSNIIPEYISVPAFFEYNETAIEKWINNPVTKPIDSGTMFILEQKGPYNPPDADQSDGLAGAGGRL